MRIVFLGFQTWGWESLNALICAGYDIPLVITHPASDHPYERIWNKSVAELAQDFGIEVVECWRLSDPVLLARIEALKADVFFASDWRTILSPNALATTALGGVNVHDALLPRYGGFAPINWAIARGETSIGLTAHMISEAVDLGDIISQLVIPVGPDMTATDAVQEVFHQLGPFSVDALQRLAKPGFVPLPQDPAAASFFPKRRPEDIVISWSQPALSIYNLIRAQSAPYPAATMRHRGAEVGVRSARPAKALCNMPGRIHICPDRGVLVTCGTAEQGYEAMNLKSLEIEGGHVVRATDYFQRMEKVPI